MWIAVAAAIVLLAFLYPRRQIPRDPDREKFHDPEASRAYDRVSKWRLLQLHYPIVVSSLKRAKVHGLLVDVGCGPGHLTAHISRKFPSLEVLGIDNNVEMIRLARENYPASSYPNLLFCLADVNDLPFKQGRVNFALSTLSLHHWAHVRQSLEEIYRALASGGKLLILDFARDNRRLFYLLLTVIQAIAAPRPLRKVNGAIGSLWASYTLPELDTLMSGVFHHRRRVKRELVWLLGWGEKQ